MLILGLFVGIMAIGLICRLFLNLSVHALPALVGLGGASFAHHAGVSLLGAGLIGFIIAAAFLGFGKAVLASSKTDRVRAGILVAFAAPAVFAGFEMTRSILALAALPGSMQVLCSGLAGVIVGSIAWKNFRNHAALF